MKNEAIAAGAKLIAAERALDHQFAGGSITPGSLASLTQAIGAPQGEPPRRSFAVPSHNGGGAHPRAKVAIRRAARLSLATLTVPLTKSSRPRRRFGDAAAIGPPRRAFSPRKRRGFWRQSSVHIVTAKIRLQPVGRIGSDLGPMSGAGRDARTTPQIAGRGPHAKTCHLPSACKV